MNSAAAGIRWGGSWSAPIHNLIYLLILVPILYIAKFEKVDNRFAFPGDNQNISILFLFGFWFGMNEFQMSLQLNQTWIYLLPAMLHLIIGLFSIKKDFIYEQ